MIAKARIIGMLHYCHKLDGIVALLFNTRQNVVLKIDIRGYFWLGRAYANVTFVYFKFLGPFGTFTFEFVKLEIFLKYNFLFKIHITERTSYLVLGTTYVFKIFFGW